MSDDDRRGLESPDTIDREASLTPTETATATTPIGVDLGEYNLYTACEIGGRPARTIGGQELCAQLGRLREQVCRFRGREVDREQIAAYVADRRAVLSSRIDAAAREVCGYAAQYETPVIVTEHFHFEADLWAWLTDPSPRVGVIWLLPTAHQRLRSIAADRGIETATVPIAYSSQACHACGVLGDRPTGREFRCHNRDCPVGTIDADRNAALVLAKRFVPGRCCAYRPGQPAHDGQ